MFDRRQVTFAIAVATALARSVVVADAVAAEDVAANDSGGQRFQAPSFKKIQLSDQFFCEGATIADVNRDGAGDVVSGPYWYAGPEFVDRHEFYPPKPFDVDGYSDNFFAFPFDFNGDGWTDILVVGFPGAETRWYENPKNGEAGHWKRHLALAVTDNESPTFTDVTGDGAPELVCMSGGQAGYAEIPTDDPTQPWQFRAVSPPRGYQRFTHGLGVGDVNGDGRQDLLQKDGWWEHPPDGASNEHWPFHDVKFSEAGGAQMFAYDFDDDGDNDVITAKAAHSYGLSWFENIGPSDDNNNDGGGGAPKFREHKIMGQRPEENEHGVVFSQLHAAALVDIDGDGVKDFVTGKRWWAHKTLDPGSLEPAVLYWFRTTRSGGAGKFVPLRIDNNSGVGTQVVVDDVNGDEVPDIVVGNKKGTFVFIQKAAENEAATISKPSSDQTHEAGKGSTENEFQATAADGRPLNLDFETGDLTDWTAQGNAFQKQPVEGDKVHARRTDMRSGHQGSYWIGTYEGGGDHLNGALTSAPFKVTHPFASFRVGGGAGKALGVQLVRADDGEVILHASGRNHEEMQPVVAELRDVLGDEIFIRVIDRGSAGWAHVNFDHFRFHATRPALPASAQATSSADGKPTPYPYAGLPADEAVGVMKLPPGFKAQLCAAEPDVKQPIAMAIDDRGRVWIAEAYEYPVRAPEGKGRDRILIFEDVDGDGKFDRRTVFAEGLNLVSGIEVGFGGVWVGAAPYLMFIPDRDGDDVADGEPEILLDGWAYQDTHETLNTFIWGPDGWLYGCHGVFTHSRVGKPGAPDNQRVPLNAAIWRYHPTRHEFEIFAEGTSNPWGVDFDDHGQAFATACVIPHLYHIIPGARYQRQAGSHFNPHTYDDIKTIADHLHYIGDTPWAGNATSDDAGGGHAHAGAMIYLGGAWPEEYRGRIFMNNIHGQRINTDILNPRGSGYVGSHGPDFLLSGDLASQILNIRYGPDGNAYVIDWYDTNACHHKNVEGHDRSNGRIYKIVYGDDAVDDKFAPVDLAKHSDVELAELALHKNDWYVRHARRLLQERHANGGVDAAARDRLLEIAAKLEDPTRELRAMWALHVTGGLPNDVIFRLLRSPSEHVRAWLVRLLADKAGEVHSVLEPMLGTLAEQDSSPVVRLAVASALERAPSETRWTILDALLTHAEDADDHNLPLMYWYAAEPLAEVNPRRALNLALAHGDRFPMLRKFMIQRIASSDMPEPLAVLVEQLSVSERTDEQLALIGGLRTGLRGRRRVAAPDAWPAAYAHALESDSQDVRNRAAALGVTFGDQAAMNALRETVASNDAEPAARREALEALQRAKDPQLADTLLELLDQPAMRQAALSALAFYDDEKIPSKVLSVYDSLSPAEKRTALATLGSRPQYALDLLRAVEKKQVPAADLSADLVRQLQNLNDPELDRLLIETWGQVRSTPADKVKLIAEMRQLIDHPPAPLDLALGRAVYAKTCQQCHVLYGVGGNIGPEITGANRSDLTYLLTNIVDPSAVITKEYQPTGVRTIDGLVISGLVKAEDDRSLTIQTTTDVVVIPKDEIEERSLSDVSMMPADQLNQFKPAEIASLLAYLSGKQQAALLARPDNQELFFNGTDLAFWSGNEDLWSVEDGEIVGRSAGLEKNEFLFSDFLASDFQLTFDVKLVDDQGNSGVQFRSERQPDGLAKGYQADIGPGWWGKLYEEHGRALLSEKSGEQFVNPGQWNQYKIVARGASIQTWINGNPCVDLNDPAGKRRGVFALQLHSGGPTEVRFRDLQLEVLE